MSAALPQPHDGADLVGSYHRFGEIGPAYEVVDTAASGLVRILVLESGEELDYPVCDVREDPKA